MFVFGFDVALKKPKTSSDPGIKKVCVLQIYIEAPEREDMPAGVFGAKGVQLTEWRELPRTEKAQVFQHSGGSVSDPAPGSTATLEELLQTGEGKDSPTTTNSPVASPAKTGRPSSQ